jgi:hypothetical protein
MAAMATDSAGELLLLCVPSRFFTFDQLFQSQAGIHRMVVSRSNLAKWWDSHYDDGFSWLSDHGGQCYDSLRQKNVGRGWRSSEEN